MAKMFSKKRRTMDVYKRIGSELRSCREILVLTVCALGGVLKADEWKKVERAITLLNEACDAAESRMFRDHPDIGNEYFAVFHGSLSGSPNSAIDEEIRGLAKDFVDGFFT